MDDERLISSSPVTLEREILRAAANESAPPDVRRRALATLGLLVIAPPAAAATGAGAGGAVGKSLWWQAWLSKAGLVVGLGGAVVGGAIVLNSGTTPAERSAAMSSAHVGPGSPKKATLPVAPPASAAQAPVAAAQTEPVEPSPTSVAEQIATLPGAPARDAAVSARRAPVSARAKWASQLAAASGPEAKRAISIRDEIDLLDRARAAMRRGVPKTALAVIDEYFARHPRGELSEEAALVRAQASRARDQSVIGP